MMPQLSSLKPENSKLFALFVGRSGDGKSVAEASFPKPLKIFDLDFRVDGVLGGVPAGCLKEIDKEQIEFEQFNPMSGFTQFDKALENLMSQRKSGNFPYKTLQIDSLFALTRMMRNTANSEILKVARKGVFQIGDVRDYKYEADGTHQTFDILRTLPCNIVVSAHIIDKFGKEDKGNPYSEKVPVGEKLTITDKLGENVLTYFSNVFYFSREVINGRTRYYVEFSNDLAKNTFSIGAGRYDITGKNFYEALQKLIKNPELKTLEEKKEN